MPMESLAALVLMHPPVRSRVHNAAAPIKTVIRGAGCGDDSFTKGPHLITPKSGHTDTQEQRLLYGGSGPSDFRATSGTSQTALRFPTALRSREQDFNRHTFPVLPPKGFLPTWCVGAALINLFM
ncbi:unnamed protein product [Pleuronectes platessa]|uniref:Uncharacterized protein n=1 Tax=Pleuronectes platessa TaxID=8262 RepID=A0A9N7UZH4_PLEPL|nr:unnamed protein product [Pleuronectes platessa]